MLSICKPSSSLLATHDNTAHNGVISGRTGLTRRLAPSLTSPALSAPSLLAALASTSQPQRARHSLAASSALLPWALPAGAVSRSFATRAAAKGKDAGTASSEPESESSTTDTDTDSNAKSVASVPLPQLESELAAALKRFKAADEQRHAPKPGSAAREQQPQQYSEAESSEFLAAAAALVKAQSKGKLVQAQKVVSDAIAAEEDDVKVEKAEKAVENVESSTKSLCDKIELMRYKIRMSDAEAELIKAQQACHQAELAHALMETSLLEGVLDGGEQRKKDTEDEFKKAKSKVAQARIAVQRIYDEI